MKNNLPALNHHHINIIFPHQLFEESPLPLEQGKVILIEEELFFNQYHFHKQKLAFHRASMKFYEGFLKEKGIKVQYISATEKLADIRNLVANLGENGTQTIHFIDPDEVYRWFMELFIDSYDWVMVPNVYGMSQFADGGLMSTKPYISGSNYLLKMSDYPKGDWQEIWDGLFWRFMHVHRDFFQQNPRLGMLVGTFDKMDVEKREGHLAVAERYLGSLG